MAPSTSQVRGRTDMTLAVVGCLSLHSAWAWSLAIWTSSTSPPVGLNELRGELHVGHLVVLLLGKGLEGVAHGGAPANVLRRGHEVGDADPFRHRLPLTSSQKVLLELDAIDLASEGGIVFFVNHPDSSALPRPAVSA